MVERKHFRKKRAISEDDDDNEEDEDHRRLALEEMKLLQKQRERKSGLVAGEFIEAVISKMGENANNNNKTEGEGEKEELVLQDTFAQETAVTVEDPNMLKYVEQELAKKRGKQIAGKNAEEEVKPPEDDLYVVPDHLKVRRRNSEESSTQWTTGIAEIQLPIEYKLRNIEETEAAKKQLQDKRPFVGRGRPQSSIPSSYSADYFQRGREYAEKLRRDHPELYKDRDAQNSARISGETAQEGNMGVRRQAATDEIMLERFRKRERSRLMRR
ncbi:protein COP1 SUPPRESSOR 2 [Cryptomeria japonica]|uniref:protein COP1 SUPPRESSOR 2 n=1 Tax=Cryptomeria japonica TaxID=3369 RepID=UPI0027DA4C92|nr:protein COP1 SUPPRESSOR 2 [Cryptomeria japonica]XP_057821296.2 protein COP1 SUPPRESSOR 2 [Cryptomeria japonica]